MDFTVYLPNELGTRARAADLPYSALFRAAVESELHEREAMAQLTGEAREHKLDLETSEGHRYKGRLTGTLVAEGRNGNQFYVAEDERYIVYSSHNLKLWDISELDEEQLLEELRSCCDSDEEYIAAVATLGLEPPVLDI